MVDKIFDKMSTGSGFKKLKNTTKSNFLILADELHKPIIRKFNKRKVYSQFEDNIWGVDLADMQSLSRKNKGIKYLLAERFIRTLKNKLYKHMTATGKNVYYDVLDDVGNKYDNTKHSTIEMKPIDVGDNNKRVYTDEHNEKDSRFKVGDRARTSRYKNIFAKGYTPSWSKEIFIVDKVNDAVPYTCNLKDLNDAP